MPCRRQCCGRCAQFNTVKKLLLILAICCTGCSDGSLNESKRDTEKVPNEDPVTPDMAEFRKLYPERYKIDYRLELATPDSVYHFFVRHYCLYDSLIIVPARYNFDTNEAFITHNFESEILITRNGETLVKKKVTKADFQSELFSSLDSFGVMLPPTCRVENEKLKMDYSISIPVTDVGLGVTLLVDTIGNFSIKK